MHLSRILLRLAVVFGLFLNAPAQLLADEGNASAKGGVIKKLAEQLGLRLPRLTTEPQAGDKLIVTVVEPDRLAAYGLRDLRPGDELEVTILSDDQASVARATEAEPGARVAADAPRLVVAMDQEGTIDQMQIVQEELSQPLSADRLQEAPSIEPSR